MAEPLLENTRALEEMVAALHAQGPATGAAAGTVPSQVLQSEFALLSSRMKELADLYKQGVAPGSLGAGVARQRVVEQQKEVGKQFGGLTAPEQQVFLPQLKILQEQTASQKAEDVLKAQKKLAEEEELRRRKQLNETMEAQKNQLRNFGSSFASMISLSGIVNPATGLAAGIGAFAGLMGKIAREGQVGAGLANPTVGATAEVSNRLRLAAQAEEQGNIETERARARFRQTQAALAHDRARRGETSLGFGLGATTGGGNLLQIMFQRFERARLEGAVSRDEEEMRRRGLLAPGQKFQAKEDIQPVAQTRFTTGEEYYMQLGNAALQASGQQASNEELRRQLENVGMLLQSIDRKMDNLPPPVFGT